MTHAHDMSDPAQASHTKSATHNQHPYRLFALTMLLSYASMNLLMFTMIDTWGDFYNNVNTALMSLTMLAAMGAHMLLFMPSMYPNPQLNRALCAGFAIAFVLALAGIRTQTPIGNEQFMASMIPHHSGAILMCREANLTDAELQTLCEQIQSSQGMKSHR